MHHCTFNSILSTSMEQKRTRLLFWFFFLSAKMRTVHGVDNRKMYRKRRTTQQSINKNVYDIFCATNKYNKPVSSFIFSIQVVCSAYRSQIMKTFLFHFRDCCGCAVCVCLCVFTTSCLSIQLLLIRCKSRKYLIHSCGQLCALSTQ